MPQVQPGKQSQFCENFKSKVMERITRKMIDVKFAILATISNQQKTKDCKYYLAIDYAAVYGGYRLVSVNSEHGGHHGAFGQSSICPRMTAKEFYMYLSGLIEGIEYNNSKNI